MIQKREHAPPELAGSPEAPAQDDADDAALVRAAQRDPVAFGQLYQAYRDRMYWYLLARTGNVEDAADLTQQVFLKALDALPQYRPQRGSFVAWLFGIARNAATNFRQRSLQTVAWDFQAEEAKLAMTRDPEETVVRQEALDQLRRLCATLDPAKQELLALRFVAGLTSAEIGAVIGKSEAAAKKQLTRILQSLKERYRDDIA